MNVNLNAKTRQFIEELVNSELFPTPEAVIEAAIADMREYDFELTAEDIAAIKEADEQAERGEVIELSEVRDRLAKRFPGVR